jgi:hypothetical protein
MSRFLVEVSVESNALARKWIKESVRTMGSHFATHAIWNQKNGMCTGAIIVETDNQWRALNVIPPNMRSHAHIFQLEAVAPL